MVLHSSKRTAVLQLTNCLSSCNVKTINEFYDGKLFCDIIKSVFPEVKSERVEQNVDVGALLDDEKCDTSVSIEPKSEVVCKDSKIESEVVAEKVAEGIQEGNIESTKSDFDDKGSVAEEESKCLNKVADSSDGSKSAIELANSTEGTNEDILKRYKFIQDFIDERYKFKSETVITISACCNSDELELAKVSIFILSEVVNHYAIKKGDIIQTLFHLDPQVQDDLEQCFNYLINERQKITKEEVEKMLGSHASYKGISQQNPFVTPKRTRSSNRIRKSSPKIPKLDESVYTDSPLKTYFESPIFTKEDMMMKTKEIEKTKKILNRELYKSFELEQEIKDLKNELTRKVAKISNLKSNIKVLKEENNDMIEKFNYKEEEMDSFKSERKNLVKRYKEQIKDLQNELKCEKEKYEESIKEQLSNLGCESGKLKGVLERIIEDIEIIFNAMKEVNKCYAVDLSFLKDRLSNLQGNSLKKRKSLGLRECKEDPEAKMKILKALIIRTSDKINELNRNKKILKEEEMLTRFLEQCIDAIKNIFIEMRSAKKCYIIELSDLKDKFSILQGNADKKIESSEPGECIEDYEIEINIWKVLLNIANNIRNGKFNLKENEMEICSEQDTDCCVKNIFDVSMEDQSENENFQNVKKYAETVKQQYSEIKEFCQTSNKLAVTSKHSMEHSMDLSSGEAVQVETSNAPYKTDTNTGYLGGSPSIETPLMEICNDLNTPETTNEHLGDSPELPFTGTRNAPTTDCDTDNIYLFQFQDSASEKEDISVDNNYISELVKRLNILESIELTQSKLSPGPNGSNGFVGLLSILKNIDWNFIKKCVKLYAQNSNSVANVAETKCDCDSVDCFKLKKLEVDGDQLNDLIKKYTAELSEKQKIFEKLKKEDDELNTWINNNTDQVDKKLKGKNDQLNNLNQDYITIFSENQKKIVELEEKLNEKERLLSQHDDQLNAFHDYTTQLSQKQKKIEELESKLSEMERNYQGILESQMNDQQKMNAMNRKIEIYKIKYSRMKNESEKRFRYELSKRRDIELKCQKLKAECVDMDTKYKEFRIKSKREIYLLKMQIRGISEKNQALEKEVLFFRSQNEDLCSEIQYLESQIKSLNDQMKALSQTLDTEENKVLPIVKDAQEIDNARNVSSNPEFICLKSETVNAANESIFSGVVYRNSMCTLLNYDEESFLNHSSISEICKDNVTEDVQNRLWELHRRNTMLPEHLKTLNPVELDLGADLNIKSESLLVNHGHVVKKRKVSEIALDIKRKNLPCKFFATVPEEKIPDKTSSNLQKIFHIRRNIRPVSKKPKTEMF